MTSLEMPSFARLDSRGRLSLRERGYASMLMRPFTVIRTGEDARPYID